MIFECFLRALSGFSLLHWSAGGKVLILNCVSGRGSDFMKRGCNRVLSTCSYDQLCKKIANSIFYEIFLFRCSEHRGMCCNAGMQIILLAILCYSIGVFSHPLLMWIAPYRSITYLDLRRLAALLARRVYSFEFRFPEQRIVMKKIYP